MVAEKSPKSILSFVPHEMTKFKTKVMCEYMHFGRNFKFCMLNQMAQRLHAPLQLLFVYLILIRLSSTKRF